MDCFSAAFEVSPRRFLLSRYTTGYLDTPAKYRDMPYREPEREIEEMNVGVSASVHIFQVCNLTSHPPAGRAPLLLKSKEINHLFSTLLVYVIHLQLAHVELPSAKRRRTLADHVYSAERCLDRHRGWPHCISTAFISIGAHFPLAHPRLSWRDQGEQSGTTSLIGFRTFLIHLNISRPQRLPRRASPVLRRHPCGTPLGVITASLVQDYKPVTPPCSVSPAYTSPRSELDYVHVHHAGDVEPDVDQMDWIGDRLTRLIQEGQKALGREIVVMSDAKENEVDDGSDTWEEEQHSQPVPSVAGPSISRRGSVRSLRRNHKPRDIPLPPSYTPYPTSPPSSASARKRRFESDSVHLSPGRSMAVSSTSRLSACGTSVESDAFAPIVSRFKEDESVWQSLELRESMERARARYLQRWVR
ncbi:hypothetical protein L210DRAFT_3640902 [Boletus edulis BED1]|uniref:Uncharacterized protein n=1 Tax=Boletus edulis BED1 TaxID=1328754 RepID=A0AAD4GKK3_BOLED|nr:hypothetical protein L210DRAFT_3640902 [Boletus edulis BED1]